jgi:branched-subunit amino acid transport protein
MDQQKIFLIIIGMTVVTYVPRFLPTWLLSSRTLPEGVQRWLRFVPGAVLAAMLAPTLLMRDGQLQLNQDNLFLWAAIPTVMVAWRTQSFFGTVVTGICTVAAGRMFNGG